MLMASQSSCADKDSLFEIFIKVIRAKYIGLLTIGQILGPDYIPPDYTSDSIDDESDNEDGSDKYKDRITDCLEDESTHVNDSVKDI